MLNSALLSAAKAERCNRTLADLIRARLIEQCLPKVLWGMAVLHAYLHNHAYTTALLSITPYKRWAHKKPNVSSLQEFGLPVSVLHEGPSKKLSPKGNIDIFVGFEDGPKAIRDLSHVNPLTLQEVKDSDEWPEWEKAIVMELDQM
jgi:hypothetical protein